MEGIRILLEVLFALGAIAALGFVAWGGWLAFRHSQFVAEGQGRFEHRHRRRVRTAPRHPGKARLA
jgi:hypothetical protein